MAEIEYAPNGKIILRPHVEPKPLHPGFTCSLCDEHRDIWEVGYKNDLGTWLCNRCTLDGMNYVQGPSYYREISWIDCKTISIARSITHELKNGRKYGRTIDGGSIESGGADHGACDGPEGSSRGQDIRSGGARQSRAGTAGSPRRPLRGHGAEVHRQSGEADISGLSAHVSGSTERADG